LVYVVKIYHISKPLTIDSIPDTERVWSTMLCKDIGMYFYDNMNELENGKIEKEQRKQILPQSISEINTEEI
jgi:hypothetical protein